MCRTFGYQSIADLYNGMDASAYELFKEDYMRAPWGDVRSDINQAIQTSSLVNVHIPKNSSRVTPSDFIPFSPRSYQSADDALDWVRSLNNGG